MPDPSCFGVRQRLILERLATGARFALRLAREKGRRPCIQCSVSIIRVVGRWHKILWFANLPRRLMWDCDDKRACSTDSAADDRASLDWVVINGVQQRRVHASRNISW